MTDQELDTMDAVDKAKFKSLNDAYDEVDKNFNAALNALESARRVGQINSEQHRIAQVDLIDALNRFPVAKTLEAIQAVIDKYLPLGKDPECLERL
jgi:hypothetical protein